MSAINHIQRRREVEQRVNDPILRRREVEQLIGLSRSTIYRLIEKGDFPKPIRLTACAVGWRQSVVEQWLNSRCEDNAA